MYTVYFTKYFNDFTKRDMVKTYPFLSSLEEWLFGIYKGSYDSSNLWFSDPDKKELPDRSSIQTYDGTYWYWVDKIEYNGVIIYSDGKYTDGIKHWNNDMKEFVRRCRQRKCHPKFNFG